MQPPDLEPSHWSTCAFVKVSQAARITARSEDWIRALVGDGRLEAVRLSTAGPFVITVSSLLQLIEAAQPVAPADVTPRRPPRSKPRLVVSNS